MDRVAGYLSLEERTMPTIHVSVVTSLSPQEAIRRLSDFGPNRAETWPNVDRDRVKVHQEGPNWADVTEGNRFAWERERYEWDTEAGTVFSVTTDSNVWQAGPAWSYRLIPQQDGTRVEVTAHRQGKGAKGMIIGALLSIIGKRMISSSTASALRP
jgi:hypothetical protein